jgi:hypothetical protein
MSEDAAPPLPCRSTRMKSHRQQRKRRQHGAAEGSSSRKEAWETPLRSGVYLYRRQFRNHIRMNPYHDLTGEHRPSLLLIPFPRHSLDYNISLFCLFLVRYVDHNKIDCLHIWFSVLHYAIFSGLVLITFRSHRRWQRLLFLTAHFELSSFRPSWIYRLVGAALFRQALPPAGSLTTTSYKSQLSSDSREYATAPATTYTAPQRHDETDWWPRRSRMGLSHLWKVGLRKGRSTPEEFVMHGDELVLPSRLGSWRVMWKKGQIPFNTGQAVFMTRRQAVSNPRRFHGTAVGFASGDDEESIGLCRILLPK